MKYLIYPICFTAILIGAFVIAVAVLLAQVFEWILTKGDE